MLRLHAWRLSSLSSERKAFRAGLRIGWPIMSENLPRDSTKQNGDPSFVGVIEEAPLHSLPLYSK